MEAAINNTTGFYYNVEYTSLILYEVEGSQIKVTTYSGNAAVKQTVTRQLGNVRTPDGKVVERTSAYGKVSFDIKSIIDGSYIKKSRSIYCDLEIEN